ncbi:hypothetical protein QBC33DRAFT_73745 [Phialemonium atrogriseum]|uniref:Uncharacterized protein n=1 Tax=Phialemonium atrogriseum TaxID=1093897 RepID=A0AAJ0C3L2_9PEZI|nr:uncharacterized protein QBC33DRAFT_73745 [Phialemonium atrogriseum]KAK1767001.1 hypothetical protein QBC33DRAFT_73745 [Phialemonium atrogriseum]
MVNLQKEWLVVFFALRSSLPSLALFVLNSGRVANPLLPGRGSRSREQVPPLHPLPRLPPSRSSVIARDCGGVHLYK